MTLASDGGPGFASHESPDAILRRIAKLKQRLRALKRGGDARRRCAAEIVRLEESVLRGWAPKNFKRFEDVEAPESPELEQLEMELREA